MDELEQSHRGLSLFFGVPALADVACQDDNAICARAPPTHDQLDAYRGAVLTPQALFVAARALAYCLGEARHDLLARMVHDDVR